MYAPGFIPRPFRSTSRVLPAGQAAARCPANFFPNEYGFCIDAAGVWNGGPDIHGNAPTAGQAVYDNPATGLPTDASGNPVEQTPAPVSPPAPSSPSVPSGLPTGTVTQAGSSVTPTFIAITGGAILLVAAMTYYLTRAAPEPERRVMSRRSNPSRISAGTGIAFARYRNEVWRQARLLDLYEQDVPGTREHIENELFGAFRRGWSPNKAARMLEAMTGR